MPGFPARPGQAPAPGSPPRLIAILASAGGLEPVKELVGQLSRGIDGALLILQHHPDDQVTALPALLAPLTDLPVRLGQEGEPLRPDDVVILPGGMVVREEAGQPVLARPGAVPTHLRPGDQLLQSVAAISGARAIGIVLSGTGMDGTEGLRAIRAAGGTTLAQEPASAAHASMPRNAIEAGVVAGVLAPSALAGRLRELLSAPRRTGGVESGGTVQEVCAILARRTGQDFQGYKQGTLLRRILRRARACGCASIAQYVRHLEGTPEEASLLLGDLLIGVTEFFRDPDAFDGLGAQLRTGLSALGPGGDPVRIWVPGCASGEEAYSLAMLADESLEAVGSTRQLQVFGTDIDAEALVLARRGLYGPEAAQGVDPERRARFFTEEADGWRIRKELRAQCLFVFHNLAQDPPFASLDLVSCRNLFIYLQPELQQRIVPMLQFSLKPGGLLFLGPSDGLGSIPEHFDPVDAERRIFRRKEGPARFLAPLRASGPAAGPAGWTGGADSAQPRLPASPSGIFERLLLEEFVPASAIVDGAGEVLYGAGQIGRYLGSGLGTPSTNLLRAVPGTLGPILRRLLDQVAGAPGGSAQAEAVVVRSHEREHLRVLVRSLPGMGRASGTFAVILLPADARKPDDQAGNDPAGDNPLIDQLDLELQATRAELQMTIEDLESVNEELRSSNEELQTSQEELRSVNEELVTINRELHEKNQELLEANSDLQNLFAATDIATIFLDTELRINRFTPAATGLFGLRAGDTGRPILDLAPRLIDLDLPALARAVLADQLVRTQQVRSLDGRRWFIARCLPYRGPGQTVDGVVATFVDCTEIQLARAAVADRDERLLKIQMGAQAGTWERELDSGRITWSAGFFRLLGLDPGLEPSLDLWKSVVHPEDAARILPDLDQAVAAGLPHEHEYRVLHPDGTVTWVLTFNSVDHDEQGKPFRLAGISLDITVRKQMELRAAASEERLEEALRRSHTGAWAWEVATRKAYRSAEHARIMGQDSAVGPWNHDRFLAMLLPEDRDRISQGIREALAAGREWDLEGRIRRSDGAVRWIRVAGGSSGTSAAGWVSGIVQDITDRKLVELERVQSEARFSAAFQASPDAIAITEAESGVYTLVNEGFARTMGFPASQVIGHTALELGLWVDPEARGRLLEAVLAGNRAGPVEALFRRADGSLLAGEISSRLFRMDDKLSILTLIRDVTQARQDQEARRLLEAEMVQLQKMESLGRLAGGIAHDMNNVLAAIFAVSQILRGSLGDDGRFGGDLEALERAAARGRDLVKALVGFSRKDSGTFAAIDLNDMLCREKEILDRTLLQKHQVLTDLQEDLPMVMGDAGALGSALMNLCVNAVDAMPGGGTLTLRTRKLPGGMVQLEVEDSGEGMAPEILDRAIEPFFTTKAQGKGTGLGLAQVFNTARTHGGQLNLASRVGIGTCARITLPSTSAEVRTGHPEPEAVATSGLDVLFVDDDDLLRDTVPRMLEILGCRVRCADGGAGALGILRGGWHPDLVILDMNMPGRNGLQVLGEIRTFLPRLPVILATGFTDANLAAALEADPCLRVTFKPFTVAEIQAQIHEVEPLLERPGARGIG